MSVIYRKSFLFFFFFFFLLYYLHNFLCGFFVVVFIVLFLPLVCWPSHYRHSTGYGECLLDEPAGRTYELPTLLPGQIYNANRQCELMFGPGSQLCPYMVFPPSDLLAESGDCWLIWNSTKLSISYFDFEYQWIPSKYRTRTANTDTFYLNVMFLSFSQLLIIMVKNVRKTLGK